MKRREDLLWTKAQVPALLHPATSLSVCAIHSFSDDSTRSTSTSTITSSTSTSSTSTSLKTEPGQHHQDPCSDASPLLSLERSRAQSHSSSDDGSSLSPSLSTAILTPKRQHHHYHHHDHHQQQHQLPFFTAAATERHRPSGDTTATTTNTGAAAHQEPSRRRSSEPSLALGSGSTGVSSSVSVSSSGRTSKIQSPIELFEKLSMRTNLLTWRSPVLTDVSYVLGIFYDGDESLGAELLAHAPAKSRLSHQCLVRTNTTTNNNNNGSTQPPVDADDDQQAAPLQPTRALAAANVPDVLQPPNMLMFSCNVIPFSVDATFRLLPGPSATGLEPTLKAIAHAVMSHVDRTYLLYQEMSHTGATVATTAAAVAARTPPLSPQPLRKGMPVPRRYYKRIFRSHDQLSEKVHPMWRERSSIPDAVLRRPHLMRPATVDEKYRFLLEYSEALGLSAEVGVMALVFVERLVERTRISLQAVNLF